ncbi:HAD family phosphatase [Marinimicrobium sp. ABcell2]|uniref:HAD family hydrolase n=1 Tax=Marinimicrobium sp. ABcell2 TaxID=3069751 RepID=UPI0027AF59DA|nr:HAD family phosphatase [Marinimicrobium sp. ABcell2]MDQ2078281.1 HAD family phosphatase [Marinimicrobium sp. ABcell2]
MFAAVLFDCDGVLVDSEVLATRALHRSVQQLGMSLTLQEVDEVFTGHSWPDCLAMVEARLGRPIPDLEGFKADNRQYAQQLMRAELAAMPGIKAVLEKLTLPYALVTNSQVAELDVKLSVTGLDQFFPPARRFDAETLAVAKPNPAIYQRAAQSLGLDIHKCLVVEDSLPGITAATNAGATVWAYRPHVSAEQLLQLGVQHSFHHWADFSPSHGN